MLMKSLVIAVVVALVATVVPAQAAHVSLLTTKQVTDFSHFYTGAEIYDSSGSGYQNGWTSASTAGVTYTTTGSTLNITTAGSTSGSTLNGGSSTNGSTTWLAGVNDDFTLEMSVKVNSAPNGARIWMGNDNERIFLDIYDDRIITTNNGGGLKTVFVDMTDDFHTIRVASDGGPGNSDIHVWLDNAPVSDPDGGVYNSGTNDNRLLFGDSTSGTFGDSFNVDIAYFAYETTGAFAVPEPTTFALLALGALGLTFTGRRRRRS